MQCEQIEDVQSALVLLRDDAGEGSYIPAALWPDETVADANGLLACALDPIAGEGASPCTHRTSGGI